MSNASVTSPSYEGDTGGQAAKMNMSLPPKVNSGNTGGDSRVAVSFTTQNAYPPIFNAKQRNMR